MVDAFDEDELSRTTQVATFEPDLNTDRLMVEPIKARTEALLAAMPEETDHDRQLAHAVAQAQQPS